MIGERHEKLVIKKLYNKSARGCSWICVCDCGKRLIMTTTRFRSVKSCGCDRSKIEKRKPLPPQLNTPENKLTIKSWANMLARCHNPKKQKCYEGITICDEWYDFANFLRDMGPRPSKEYTLDREKPELGYFKANCRWITKSENCARVRRWLKSPESYKRAGLKTRQGWAEGRIKHSPEGSARISAGSLKRVGRKLQDCEKCGQPAYLPQCQRCRGLRK